MSQWRVDPSFCHDATCRLRRTAEGWTENFTVHLGAMQVLTTAESNKDLIRIDPLQRLHTLTNLSELLESGVQGIARTLRDDQLQKQAEEIRQVGA